MSSGPQLDSRYAATARWRAFRSFFENVSYAMRRTRSWRNPYWPRSGDRGLAWTDTRSFRLSEARIGASAPSAILVTAASPFTVNDLPSTEASCSTECSSADSPSSRDAMSACRVSGTSSSSIGAVGRYASPSRITWPRSSSIRTVSTA